MKNTKFISHRTIIDTETGVEIDCPDYKIVFPELIKIDSYFLKICKRAVDSLKKVDLARLSALQPNLEWQTNRLVNKHVGRSPIPLKQKDMAIILNVTERTISSFISRLINEKAIFKFDSQYYINPSFASKSHSYYTDIIIRMMKEDPNLEKYINKADLKNIKLIKRIENMNW